MILSRDDPHRGRCGHHHDRHRSSGSSAASIGLVCRCCVLIANVEESARLLAQAKHLSASLEAELVVADLGPAHNGRGFLASSVAGFERCFHMLVEHDRGALLRVAQSSDFVIVANSRLEEAREFATSGGRPVLVLPPDLGAERIGSRVIIFWDERGCSAIALRDVMPLLRDAVAISIVGDCADGAIAYLEGHGFAVGVVESDDLETIGSADLFAGGIPTGIVASHRDRAALLISSSW